VFIFVFSVKNLQLIININKKLFRCIPLIKACSTHKICARVSTDACGQVALGADKKKREKSKLSEHAYKDHRVGWDETRTFFME
jgi:hypothetical protein